MSPKTLSVSDHCNHANHKTLILSPRAVGLVIVTFAAMIQPMISHGSDLQHLLTGKAYPLAFKLKDFDKEWRRLTVHGSASISGNVSVNVSGTSAASTSQNNNLVGALGGSRTYVTKGETASAHGQTYLVTYHLPGAGLDLGALLQAVATKTAPAEAVLTAESVLPLSLLDVRAITSLEDVRAFDMQWEIGESEKAAKTIATLLQGEEKAKAPKSDQRESSK